MSPKKSKQHSRLKDRRLVLLLLIFISLFLIFLGVNFFGQTNKDAANPSPAISYQKNITGIYKGNLPCADCTSLEETIILAGTTPDNGTYIQDDLYVGKSDQPFKSQGVWKRIKSNVLELTDSNPGSIPNYFQILENGDLQMLDSNMQKIDSPFNQTLNKL